jgi:hypothetical protein
MSISTRSLKKWVPSDTSGTSPSCIVVNSPSTAARLISANDTGTPSAGMDVPHRPGPNNITMPGPARFGFEGDRPIARATA